MLGRRIAESTSPEVGDAIDAGAIDTLRSMDSGDEGFMGKIIELFLADLTERLAALKAAAEARDGRALKASRTRSREAADTSAPRTSPRYAARWNKSDCSSQSAIRARPLPSSKPKRAASASPWKKRNEPRLPIP